MEKRFSKLQLELDQLRDINRLRSLTTDDSTKDRDFSTNDYLSLSQRSIPFPCDIAGGAGASALLSGWTPAHQRLADRICRFEQTEAAVVFPTGYAACQGVISALPSASDLIVSDALNHASLIDGCRLSKAEKLITPHRDPGRARDFLVQARHRFDHVWILTEGVFGMDGTVAPLHDWCDVADEFDATLIVDEAHSTGVLGDNGRGVCEALGVEDRVPIRVGTLSKAVGCQGGFVAGPKVVVDYLVNHCRPLIFSTALSPLIANAAAGQFDLIESMTDERRRIQHLAKHFRQCMDICRSPDGRELQDLESLVPIIPWVVGTDERAVEYSQRLKDQGYSVPAIRPPTVPEGTARLRLSMTAHHDVETVNELAEQLQSFAISK